MREHVGGHVSRPSPLPIPTLDPRAANPSGESRRGGQLVRVDEPPGCEPALTEQASGSRPETCSNLRSPSQSPTWHAREARLQQSEQLKHEFSRKIQGSCSLRLDPLSETRRTSNPLHTAALRVTPLRPKRFSEFCLWRQLFLRVTSQSHSLLKPPFCLKSKSIFGGVNLGGHDRWNSKMSVP